ncbi:LysR family transcriptional regulator [Shewanella pealeana]|uniref:Transcriptional regulator, LysR family n=1 Tax=Shewanella pealeana (strain ATCC 700345 / ANG-SQ1) TaxID=398579 RepID=A8H826_SHEPA|nr:LysR family transcriptional regulator [Shewanella pealeana]ABV88713.1 transcriptional regulator, LysR family [Shewanella pealeana ATCC 700345]
MKPSFNLNLLSSFYAVARHGSFAAAADELCLTHSVISKHIKQLETSLQSQLIIRTTRALELTEEGEFLYSKCQSIFNEVLQVKDFIDEKKRVVSGRLVIKMPSILKHDDGIAKSLEFMHLTYPGLMLDIVFDDNLGDLVKEGVDIAFRIGKLEDSSYLCRKVRDIDTYVVASPEYLKVAGTPLHPNELTQHKCLHYSHCLTGLNWSFKQNGEQFNVPITPALSSMSESMLAQYACKGFGVTTTLDFVTAKDIESARLVSLLKDFTWKTELYLVFPYAAVVPLKTRSFINSILSTRDNSPESNLG